MAKAWQASKMKGVRYYTQEDRPRLKGNRIDRCWGIRYRVNGKKFEAILGWTSEGWGEDEVFEKRKLYIENLKAGKRPESPADEVQLGKEQEGKRKKKEQAEAYLGMSFKDFTEKKYFPSALTSIKPKTAKDYRDQATMWIFPVVGDLPFSQITLHHIQEIKNNLVKAGRAPRTIQAVFRTFTAIWYGAMDAELTEKRPPTKNKAFKLPKLDNKRERFLTFDEAGALLAAVQKRSQQAHHVSLLSLHTGMRWGEVQALKWQAVRVDQNIIHILDPKGASRTNQMNKTVKKMFESMDRGSPGGSVFSGRNGGPLSGVPSSFKRAVTDVKLNEGITDKKLLISFHSLRHTHASWLRKSGAGLATIQEILGHSTIHMTQRYAHVDDREIKNAVTAFDQMLEANKNDGKIIPIRRLSND